MTDTVTPFAATGRLTVNPGDTVASTWGNTTFDQTVECFDTAAARDAAWPTPHDGAVCYLLDSQTPWLRRSGAWVGLPLGNIAYLAGPATQVVLGASLATIMTLTASLVAGRKYKLTCNAMGAQQTAAGTGYFNLANGPGRFTTFSALPAGGFWNGATVFTLLPSTTGPVTFTLGGQTSAGSMNVGANYCNIAVDDG
jgi:hypothetical protein